MKRKFLIVLLAMIVAIVSVGALLACTKTVKSDGTKSDGNGNNDDHIHEFAIETFLDEYLAAPATCTEKARYYYSCKCGEKDTITFEYGEPNGHTFNQRVTTSKYRAANATCTEAAKYYYSCKCGEKGATVFSYGSANGHRFSTSWSHDETYHWYAAICGHSTITKDKATHSFVNGTCQCGYVNPSYGSDGLVFEEVDGGYSVKSYSGSATEVVIPQIYNGKSVIAIGARAFNLKVLITSVKLPDGLLSIGYDGFYKCSNLTNIILPDSVTSIGNSAFGCCSDLISINIPNGIVSMGSNVFYGCDKLKYNEYDNAYYLGNSSNSYVVLMKPKNRSITDCNINSRAKLICYGSFQNCSKLTNIIVPNNVIDIGKNAFNGCSSLASASIGNNVANIGESAFRDCSKLTSITISKSVENIGKYAFWGCSNLETIYCRVASQPSGWHSDWKDGCSANVVWG